MQAKYLPFERRKGSIPRVQPSQALLPEDVSEAVKGVGIHATVAPV